MTGDMYLVRRTTSTLVAADDLPGPPTRDHLRRVTEAAALGWTEPAAETVEVWRIIPVADLPGVPR